MPVPGHQRVHLVDTSCKSHRLRVNSSYGAEGLAAAHAVDEVYPTLVTMHEFKEGVLTPEELKLMREGGGLKVEATLTVDAESVYKNLSSADVKVLAEKSLLGHVAWMRDMLSKGLVRLIEWCDTRDMSADGHTKGSIDRQLLLEVMSGWQTYKYTTKRHAPYRSTCL